MPRLKNHKEFDVTLFICFVSKERYFDLSVGLWGSRSLLVWCLESVYDCVLISCKEFPQHVLAYHATI